MELILLEEKIAMKKLKNRNGKRRLEALRFT